MNKTFCVLPWTHFFNDPTGKIMPCCSAEVRTDQSTEFPSYGNLRDFESHMDIINQDNFKQLRKNMLEGKESVECTNCYKAEQYGVESFRQNKNQTLDWMISMDEINEMTNPDGSLNQFKMRYWDNRFSNVCNLACRMCSPEYSHTIAKEEDRTFQDSYIVKAQDSDDWDQIIKKYGPFDEIFDIYFAGGEVLFQKEHWQMLDHLIHIRKTDVMIMYVTNLTKLDYNNYKLLDYLPKFRDVTFTVSMDATGDLLEYIRWGSNWDQIVKNLNALQELPNVHVRVNHVCMWYNVMALPETLDFLYGNGYLTQPQEIDLPVVHDQVHHVGALPEDLKLVAIDKIKHSTYYVNGLLRDKLDAVCNAMMTVEYPLPVEHNEIIDKRRGCSIVDVLPEIEPYYLIGEN